MGAIGVWVFEDQYNFLYAYLSTPWAYVLIGAAVTAFGNWGPDLHRRLVQANRAFAQMINKLKSGPVIIFSLLALIFLLGKSFFEKSAEQGAYGLPGGPYRGGQWDEKW
jgi:hypothetical protein